MSEPDFLEGPASVTLTDECTNLRQAPVRVYRGKVVGRKYGSIQIDGWTVATPQPDEYMNGHVWADRDGNRYTDMVIEGEPDEP